MLMEELADDRNAEFRGAKLTSRGRLKVLYSVMQNIEKEVRVIGVLPSRTHQRMAS